MSGTGDGPGPGILALVGGAEWTEGCSFDSRLLTAGGGEVLVLPTAAAYEHPERAVHHAMEWFGHLGGRAVGLMVLGRRDAEEPSNAETVRQAGFIYLSGGSPLHLRSVLKGSRVWQAIFESWESGAVVAGSSAGAMVLTDPMVDPRGGAFTLGLGLVEQLSIIPHYGSDVDEKAHRRTISLAAKGLPVAGVPEKTALIRERDGSWVVEGQREVEIFVDGKPAEFSVLPT